MTFGLKLEDFGASPTVIGAPTAPDDDAAPLGTPPDPQTDLMESFDAAYKAGYDDAVAAMTTERTHIGAEFARNLQNLSFTFHEARQQVSASLQPLVSALVSQVLPSLAQTALADQLLTVLQPLIYEMNTPTLRLVCAPDDVAVLETLLADTCGLPVELAPEPSLMRGQATFSLGHEVHRFDLEGLLADVSALVADHFETLRPSLPAEELSHAG